jgi:hypothetical protein
MFRSNWTVRISVVFGEVQRAPLGWLQSQAGDQGWFRFESEKMM